MKSRPKSLLVLSVILIAVAISLPLQIIQMHDHTISELGAISAELAPLNWMVMALALLLAALAFRASRGIIYVAPVFVIITVWNNWLVGELQPGASMERVSLASLLVAIAAFGPFASPMVRRVLVNPKLRWWLTPTRRQIALAAKVRPVKGGEVSAVTFDLSESGVFISTEHATWQSHPRNGSQELEVGAHCSLKLDLDSYRALHCIAKIVRRTEARGRYPGGFALHFEGLSSSERRMLGRFLSN